MSKTTKLLPTLLLGCATLTSMSFAQAQEDEVMFDDFSYKTLAEAEKNGWVARTQVGHPGIKNTTWWDEGITFHPDRLNLQNQVMRLTSKTDGTAINTRHTQICHQRK